MLETTNNRSILRILKYFNNLMISQKALEFKIWSKAIYYLNKNN
jgi:hypothetical protein